ncbi:MAG TPA: hypothetical protein VGD60_04625 [Candidatus Acidoferrales bacterium]
MRGDFAMKNSGRKMVSRILGAGCALALCAVAVQPARAQGTPAAAAPPPAPEAIYGERIGHGPMPPDAIEFLGFQAGLDDKVVTAAPFSATFTTESKQTLSDGNTIDRTSTGSLARDSQGRTRRDMTLPAFGPWAESGKPAPHVVAVNDPVASSRTLLEVDTKTARVMQVPAGRWNGGDKKRDGGREAAENDTVTTALGTQTIGGVSAEGTRYTRTIPAGQIGNTKPIVIVTERWYSPDLQMVVMTKHSDPRMGETSFTISNIQRTEPAATLFQVPADYAVKQDGYRGGRGNRGGPAPNAPPVEQ